MNDSCASPVSRAKEEVNRAEEALERAQRLEREATQDLRRAVEELERAEEEEKRDRDKVTVRVTHVNEVEVATFRERFDVTLQSVWDEAYKKLGVAKGATDVFQTAGQPPVSLMTHLHLTLGQAKHQNVISDFCFEIVAETGGA